MTEYPRKPMGELTENLDRRRVPVRTQDRKAGPFPYYGASGVVDYVEGFLFEGLHLLVAEDGENLRSRKSPVAFLADGKFWVNNHAHILVGNEENDTRFLSYALDAQDISGYITGSAQPKLTQAALARIPVPRPSLPEQRAIAAALGALDDKIKSNRRSVDLALNLLDAIALQEGQFLQRVPLGTLARLSKRVINPASFGGAKVLHYSIPAFDAGARPERVVASTVMSNKVALDGPAILVSRLNPRFNRTWWVSAEGGLTAFASPEYAMLQAPDRRKLAGVWLAVRDVTFREEITVRVTGTSGSHQRIRPDDLLSVETIDSHAISAPVLDRALALLDRIESLRQESEVLVTTRDALLPDLLSGRIRVPVEETMS